MVKKVGEDNKIYEGGHMSKDYKSMWSGMGLNLEAHDGLLAVLSDAYKGIYLSQKQRPAGMGYFDFVISEVHGLRIEEIVNAKESGKQVIGTFCVYVPEELVLAVDGVCIGLCAGADVGTDEAEKYIPKNTCALIKAFMGFKLAGLCPYVQLTNMIVGETTCDGKKKAYEIFNEITKKIYVMELPNMKSVDGKKLWKNEVKKFATKLEELTGKKITLDKLKDACRVVNEKRKALQRLSALRSAKPSPISGLDALLVNQVSFLTIQFDLRQRSMNSAMSLTNASSRRPALLRQKVRGFSSRARPWRSPTGSSMPSLREVVPSLSERNHVLERETSEPCSMRVLHLRKRPLK